jgi:hypothetical protein
VAGEAEGPGGWPRGRVYGAFLVSAVTSGARREPRQEGFGAKTGLGRGECLGPGLTAAQGAYYAATWRRSAAARETLAKTLAVRVETASDIGYTAAQLGHEDAVFSLKTYTHAVKRRERLTGAELEQFERSIEWAQWARMGTNGDSSDLADAVESVPRKEKAPH